jgi:hypothetical protein
MVSSHRSLTHIGVRCAGRLLEHVSRLPATQLAPHLDSIRQVAASHKIFFRVNIDLLQRRIEMANQSADYLAGQLDSAIARLTQQSQDPEAFQQPESLLQQARLSLEALRRYHPDYMDLEKVLEGGSTTDDRGTVSFQLVLASLADFALTTDGNLDEALGRLLLSPNPAVLQQSIEALTKRGSGFSATVICQHFAEAAENNQNWIILGLQRMRVQGLAPLICKMRNQTDNPFQKSQLLVAELNQMDLNQAGQLADTLDRISAAGAQELSKSIMNAYELYFSVVCQLDSTPEILRIGQQIGRLLKQEIADIKAAKLNSMNRSRQRLLKSIYRRHRR